jgi:hypothetical protein
MSFAKIKGKLSSRIGRPVHFGPPEDVKRKGGGAGAGTIIDEVWAVVIRTSDTSDKLFDDVFSRTRIARLSDGVIATLQDTLLRRLAFGRTRLGAATDQARNILESSLEILSRLALRLPTEQLRRLFDQASSFYRSPDFRRLSLFLGYPLANLLARILESLERSEIVDLLPLVFALPLPQETGLETDYRRWRDPVAELPEWFDGRIEGLRPTVWEGIVAHLVLAAKGENTIDRGAAIYRLSKLYNWQLLSETETAAFATALWMPAQRDVFGVPQHTNLPRVELLKMPEESPGQARDVLGRYITERSGEQGGDLYERVASIGEILWTFADQHIPIELSPDVQSSLAALISAWAAHQIPALRDDFERVMNRQDQQEVAGVDGSAAILPYIVVSGELTGKIWEKAEAIDTRPDAGAAHAFTLYPFLVQQFPDRKEELLNRLRRALVSDQEDEAWAALRGLHKWITALAAADAEIDDLLREVGIGISARRLALLPSGLNFAEWIFRAGPNRFRDLLVRDCDHGLTALLEEASYARSEQEFDVPAVRAACFRLAAAMANTGYWDQRGVKDWLSAAPNDPLPEVRNAQVRRRGAPI